MTALAQDLNAPAALDQLDRWAAGQLATATSAERAARVVKALLGLDLTA